MPLLLYSVVAKVCPTPSPKPLPVSAHIGRSTCVCCFKFFPRENAMQKGYEKAGMEKDSYSAGIGEKVRQRQGAHTGRRDAAL